MPNGFLTILHATVLFQNEEVRSGKVLVIVSIEARPILYSLTKYAINMSQQAYWLTFW
jgi:hypothetical protein